jgi:hypothetical protein
MSEAILRDFIYLDLPRLASIYSQLTGGLVTETEVSSGNERDQRNIRKYDLKVFKPEFGGTDKQSQRFVETRVMHHDLFNTVECLLFEKSLAIDVNAALTASDIVDGNAHPLFRKAFYVRATGWALIEDYEKMKFIAQRHGKICEFISMSARSKMKDTDEYKQLEKQINELKSSAGKQKDRNQKARWKEQIKAMEKHLEKTLESATTLEGVDQWIIDGFGAWVDTFMPNAIYFHLYPFDDLNTFHIKANLKHECFVDGDVRAVDFAYGGRPNVRLTILGLVTSIPCEGDHPFDPMAEFKGHKSEDNENDPIGFEAAMRGLFRGFEGMEKFGKFDRYPNITVYPLAVFRDIQAKDGVAKKAKDGNKK